MKAKSGIALVSQLSLVSSLILAGACTAGSKPPEAAPQPEAPVGQWSTGPEEKKIEPIAAMPVEPAKTPPAPPNVNPFEGGKLYVNPDYVEKVEKTAKEVPEIAGALKKLGKPPTAMWLESLGALKHLPRWLEDVAKQQKAAGNKPVIPVFLVYNLPNRDCSAKSSAGELTSENDGEKRYRHDFIDKIAEQFAAHPNQKIVAILEPDSLPNIATNLEVEKCALSEKIYRNSVAYAISKLSLPNVSLYLDAAHAGWLGWDGNRAKIAQIFKEVLDAAGGPDRIRGFATNVANYTSLDGQANLKLESSNPAPNEHTYVEKLAANLEAVGIKGKGFIIDTSRNGKDGVRTKWGNWCNVKGMGLGERPKIAPRPLVDAYLWVKPPGESDGTAERGAPRFDESCVSADSDPAAPQAGEWFQSYFVGLVKNANPPL
jgi:cellulose 1,4-beta-cellobiosidase